MIKHSSPEASEGPSRRDVLKGAAGVAAAVTAGGLVVGPNFVSAATTAGLHCSIPTIGEFGLFSAVWSASRQISTTTAGPSSSSSRPALEPLNLTKRSDVHTNALIRAMLTGQRLASATITFVDQSLVVQQTIALTGVTVTSLGMFSGGEPFEEEFQLWYDQIEFLRPGAASFKWDVVRETTA